MTRPRKALIFLDETPYYHCVSRCVRRAFLCGYDRLTERSFEHRRGWIVERMKQLASVFAIDIAAYAVMSNHYHVVLRVDRARAMAWSPEQVCERWTRLFKGPLLMQRLLAGDTLLSVERSLLDALCEEYRERLISISWFMRCLNETIARCANVEDACKGRFWEGRFRSQALLDETALLNCMVYVDLNPVRAGIADTPEHSDYTSIQERLGMHPTADSDSEQREPADVSTRLPHAALLPFGGWESVSRPENSLPFSFPDYLELVDWSGRAVREGKRGAIPAHAPPIFRRLGVEPDIWLDTTLHFRMRFFHAVGAVATLEALAERLGFKWLRGKKACGLLYPDPSPA